MKTKNRPQPQVKYLDSATLQKHMEACHDGEFRELATEYDRHCCKEIARGFTYIIPFVDRYAALMQRVKITEEVLRRRYTPELWDALPEGNRNQIRKAARRYNQQADRAVQELQRYVNGQAALLDRMPDEEAAMLLEDIEN